MTPFRDMILAVGLEAQMEVDLDLHHRIAAITFKLKHKFQSCIVLEEHYSQDPELARAIDEMGGLIKELEDLVVIADVRGSNENFS